jgi:hypothetical protein
MVDGITHQVGQRIGEGLEDRTIQFDIGPLDLQVDLLTEFAREIPHHPMKAIEEGADGLHTLLDDGSVHIGDAAGQGSEG